MSRLVVEIRTNWPFGRRQALSTREPTTSPDDAAPGRMCRSPTGSRCVRPARSCRWRVLAAHVPASCRWHLSCGIAHPHGDGSAWCRIPHAVICPHRTPITRLNTHIEAVRRQLAVRTRRLIDTGALPAPPPAPHTSSAESASPLRPVVQLLLGRYLADQPLKHIQCVAQTRHRRRCPQPLLAPHAPAGIWRLLPASPHHGQLALPDTLMAVYDLSRMPYAEQLRWRTQRCPAHAATPGAADLALAGWEVFDPLQHPEHIHTHLPHTPPGRDEKA